MTEEIAVREINSDARPALKDREIDEKTLHSTVKSEKQMLRTSFTAENLHGNWKLKIMLPPN